MKQLLYALVILAPIGFASCNDDDDYVTAPTASGTVMDDQGNTYEWVRIGNLDWTTSNARNGLSCTEVEYFDGNKYYFVVDDDIDYYTDEFIPQYGNLMSYEEAVKSAPDGWRLPSDEDWKALERALGMEDADNKGLRGTNGVATRLMSSDGVGFKALLAGGAIYQKAGGMNVYEMYITSTKEYGFYWTSTEDNTYEDVQTAYYRKFIYGYPGIDRQVGRTENLMSVRWCRNAVND